jgi:hypothetical protein
MRVESDLVRPHIPTLTFQGHFLTEHIFPPVCVDRSCCVVNFLGHKPRQTASCFSKQIEGKMSKEDLLLTSRFSTVGEINKNNHHAKDIVEEIATIRGLSRTIHRLYAKYENGFHGVGWIIDEDINTCMICDREFGFFLRKHHCRSCGNVVCYICSPDFVVIEEMIELGEQRVCIQCYWGQVQLSLSLSPNLTSLLLSTDSILSLLLILGHGKRVMMKNQHPQQSFSQQLKTQLNRFISKLSNSLNMMVRSSLIRKLIGRPSLVVS